MRGVGTERLKAAELSLHICRRGLLALQLGRSKLFKAGRAGYESATAYRIQIYRRRFFPNFWVRAVQHACMDSLVQAFAHRQIRFDTRARVNLAYVAREFNRLMRP